MQVAPFLPSLDSIISFFLAGICSAGFCWYWLRSRDLKKQISHLKQYLRDYQNNSLICSTRLLNQGWIICEEELPMSGETVLTFTSVKYTDEYVEPIRMSILDKDKNWINECSGVREEHKITHWMPLPELPSANISPKPS